MKDVLRRSDVDLRNVDMQVYFDHEPKGSVVRTLFPLLTKRGPGRTVELLIFGNMMMRYISGKVGLYAKAPQISDDASTSTFTLEVRNRAYFLPFALQANNQAAVDLAARAMKALKVSQLVCEEKDAATSLTSTTWWTNNVGADHVKTSGFTLWDNANATPGMNLDEWAETIEDAAGVQPNGIWMTRDIFRTLRWKIAEGLTSSGRVTGLTREELGDYFSNEMDREITVRLLSAQYDASDIGETTSDLQRIWGTNTLILARASAKESGPEEPSFGRTVESPEETIVDNEVMKNPRGTNFLLDACYVQATTYPEAGLIAQPLST
jgi:hypothetical protein